MRSKAKTLEEARKLAIQDGAVGYVSFFIKAKGKEQLFCVDFFDQIEPDDEGNLHEVGYWTVDLNVYTSFGRPFSNKLVSRVDANSRYSNIFVINKETIMAEKGEVTR